MAAVLLTFHILLFHLHLLPRGCSKQGLLSTLQLNYILSVLGCRIMSYNIVSVDAFTARLVANWIVCPLVKFATWFVSRVETPKQVLLVNCFCSALRAHLYTGTLQLWQGTTHIHFPSSTTWPSIRSCDSCDLRVLSWHCGLYALVLSEFHFFVCYLWRWSLHSHFFGIFFCSMPWLLRLWALSQTQKWERELCLSSFCQKTALLVWD
jgi:hypothetical protein